MKLKNGWTVKNIDYETVEISYGYKSVRANTVKEAYDLFYETYCKPLIKRYSTLGIDGKFSLDELIEMFHIITNCCDIGIEAFCKREPELIERAKKEGLTIRELIDFLGEERGALTFKKFFEKR